MSFTCEYGVVGTPYQVKFHINVDLDINNNNNNNNNPGGGEIFRTRSGRPWAPPSILYNGYQVFTIGKAAGAWR